MISIGRQLILLALILFVAPTGSLDAQQEPGCEFQVAFPASLSDKPITGRLFVFMSQRGGSEPRFGPNWFAPEPFFGTQVRNFQPGSTARIDDTADAFPTKLSAIKPGKYRVQAVLDHDFYSSVAGKGVGNFYSEAKLIEFDPAKESVMKIELLKIVEAKQFQEKQWLKKVEIRSTLLSDFHKRNVVQDAAVILPASYFKEPKRRYPVFYEISGFGGTLDDMTQNFRSAAPISTEGDVDLIRVMLTGQCKWGHHAYANSATNGPRGDALIAELIPEIDRRFRTVADPRARFVGGHSSGGWSSLWLQINYPEKFGGVWSTSPDPVDFRDFQRTNLYADPPQSLYFDAKGRRRPLARFGSRVLLWYPDFANMDDAIGRGGQLRSFEAVFSPLGTDGLPLHLWDRNTGRIEPEVAKAWMNYDISLVLKKNWPQLKQPLAGKIHVTMGDEDTFYLEGATILLKETMRELGSDAEIEIVSGADHMNIITRKLKRKRQDQINAAFRKYFLTDGTRNK